jgi:hypothetical protein
MTPVCDRRPDQPDLADGRRRRGARNKPAHHAAGDQFQLRSRLGISFSPVITANWDAPTGDQWTVPAGVGLTHTTVFNRRPMNIGLSYYYNLEHPSGAAGQQLRFSVTLLYPK